MWFRSLFDARLARSRRKPAARIRRGQRVRPLLEILEDRTLLSTYTVNALTDTGAGSGLTGDLRYCVTNATSGNDTITFGVSGTINVQSPLPSLNTSVNLQGPGASQLTVSWYVNSLDVDILAVGSAANVQISGLTITGEGGDYDVVVANSGTLTIRDSALSQNYNGGGLIGTIVNSGNLTVSNSTISDNSGVGINNSGSATVTNSTLSGNSVFGGYNGDGLGGGIYNTGNLTVNDSTISGNKVTGVDALSSGSSSFGNPAGNGRGGGIYMGGGTLSINSSTLANNQAIGGSAAFFSYGPGDGLGGGLYIAGGTVTIDHSTLAGNQALGGWSVGIGYVPALGYGGGIYNTVGPSALQMHDTILANNSAGNDPDLDGSLTSSGYNLIANSSGGSGFAASDLLNVNPHLGPLQNNGGPTPTMALLPGSPAINAGDPADNSNPNTPAYDQRGPGFARIVGGTIDIGAFEVQTTSPSLASSLAVSGLPSAATAGSAGSSTLTLQDPSGNSASDSTATAADPGVPAFNGLMLRKKDNPTLTGTNNGSLTGSVSVNVG